ncbi:DUF4440 domain-containing protein [Comamonas sp. Tr-654]|uniref:DUF4440 domain-containing protein n=1 Tax=Comamonas sp. Tr-654 TaxID=2608341 RepID=UPI001422B4F4|nr:DUF4440 domain-containing protein [Comamonas sp. Tr-654]NIF82088.1 DUF4440 domain-containing protein [Comamonas sp. Tr-654]
MNDQNLEAAVQSIHDVHELIRTVFTEQGDAARAATQTLMQVFAEGFSMVTTGGRIVDRAQVQQVFGGAAGGRPGLQIAVDEVQPVWHAGQHVALRYLETHVSALERHARYSTAILEVTVSGVLWHALHETAVA